jgi:hypothetical protein
VILVALLCFPFSQGLTLAMDNGKTLSEDLLQEYRHQKPYSNYINKHPKKGTSSELGGFLKWFFSLFKGNNISANFFRFLPYIIALIALVLITLRLNNMSFSNLIKPSLRKVDGDIIIDEKQTIRDIDFEKLIESAQKEENFRTAIRYSYLMLLKILDAKKLIEWEVQKSNFDYLLVLSEHAIYSSLKNSTGIYESAWYGDKPWTTEEYVSFFAAIQSEIKTITQQLKTE